MSLFSCISCDQRERTSLEMSVRVPRPLVNSPEIARQKFPLREAKLAPWNRLFLNRGTVNQDSVNSKTRRSLAVSFFPQLTR